MSVAVGLRICGAGAHRFVLKREDNDDNADNARGLIKSDRYSNESIRCGS